MELHVLNGDALAEKFPFAGEKIICREALIDGPVDARDLDSFWAQRATFLSSDNPDEYFNLVVKEYHRLTRADASVINLWFEHDLFCQVNLWFTIHLLEKSKTNASLYVVTPTDLTDPLWSGFGKMSNEDLEKCYEARVLVEGQDKQLALALWDAYSTNNALALTKQSDHKSKAFPLLAEVCKAHLDRFSRDGLGRPEKKLKSILENGTTQFDKIFHEFRQTEGVYGFGDAQVKSLLSKV
ncbi:MAG TPA: hypothetical protein VGD40_16130 [Chryseosolibacter sp.]